MKETKEENNPNPNYGRFYVCSKQQEFNPDGTPVQTDKGFDKYKLVNFTWFDETDFVTSGCFLYHAENMPLLCKLLLHTYGAKANPLWPKDAILARIQHDLLNVMAALDGKAKEGEPATDAQPMLTDNDIDDILDQTKGSPAEYDQ